MTMINSGTGTGFAEFMERMAKEGRLTSSSADATRSACQMVLGTVFPDEWERLDLTGLDVDDVWTRFTTLKGGSYTPGSMSAYKSRFLNGIEMYRHFISDPTWRPKVRPVPVKRAVKRVPAPPPFGQGEPTSATQSGGTPTADPPDSADPRLALPAGPPAPPLPGFIDHAYPLRPGVRALIRLPEDLTSREATRLAAFVEALVMEPQIALPPAQ